MSKYNDRVSIINLKIIIRWSIYKKRIKRFGGLFHDISR